MAKKRYDNLLEQIYSLDNLLQAYKNTQKGNNKLKIKSIKFSRNLSDNLLLLQKELKYGTFKPGKYSEFMVKEPKERKIFAPAFRDKIVHHAINNILKDIFNKSFIQTSYACIEGRGSHAGVTKLTEYIKSSNYKTDYFIKLDIKKFFYSINHSTIKSLLGKKIKCKGTLKLLHDIIDSSPTNPGLPLGNLTSQLFANILMNEVDQYAKRKLRLKKYIRYADDIIVICKSKESATLNFRLLKSKINSICLELNKHKSKIFPLKNGINTLGFLFDFKGRRRIRKDSRIRILRKIKKFPNLIEHSKLSVEKAECMLNSWLGHARFARLGNFIKHILDNYLFIYLSGNNLKIRRDYAILYL